MSGLGSTNAPGFPTPVETETFSVPPQDRLGRTISMKSTDLGHNFKNTLEDGMVGWCHLDAFWSASSQHLDLMRQRAFSACSANRDLRALMN